MNLKLTSMVLALACARPAAAQSVTHALSLSASASTAHYGGGDLGYALRLPRGVQLGVTLGGSASREGFVDGYEVRDGSLLRGAAQVTVPLWVRGDLSLGLRVTSGVRALSADAPANRARDSVVWTNDIGAVGAARLSDVWSLRAGWSLVFDTAVAPTVDTDAQGARLWFGAAATLRDDLQLFADVSASGVVGYDGDGAKFLLAGTLGLRWLPGGGARDWRLF